MTETDEIAKIILRAIQNKRDSDTYGVSHALKMNTEIAERAAEQVSALTFNAAQSVGMREALEEIKRTVNSRTHHAMALAQIWSIADAALSQPSPAATVETKPWSMEEALSDNGAAKVNAVLARSSAATEDDPTASSEWNDGCDFAMTQLCLFLGVNQNDVRWDAATETIDGDVQAVIGNILRAKFGEDWGPNDLPQALPDTRKHSETYRLGMDAAFNEVADYMQEQKLYAYAEHIRRRASVALSRPVRCPNGLEHGACLHPECVSSCPGRLTLGMSSQPLGSENGP